MARRPWRFGVLLLAAVVAGPAYAADPPPPDAPGRLSPDALLVSLSKPGWRDRRDAIHELCALGPDAETQVRELLKRDLDKEQRKNVERALELIRDNRQLGASLITLHLKNASAAEAIQSLIAQTGGGVPTDPSNLWKSGPWPALTLDVNRQPFWDVLKSLSARVGFSYINDAQELQFTRLNGGSSKVADRVSTDGAFIFGANAYTTRRSMVVEIIACGEPKAPVMRTLDLTIQRGVDDQGNELMAQSGRGGMGRRGGGGFMGGARWGAPTHEGPRLVNAIFQRPQDGVSQISELSGQITISVQTGLSTWEIDDPLNTLPVARTIDSVPVTIASLRGGGDSYELRASVPFGGSDSKTPADEIIDLMRRNLQVLDPKGNVLPMGIPDPTRYTSTTDISVDFTLATGKTRLGLPAKIVWQVPEVRKVKVPFVFKDLPISDGF